MILKDYRVGGGKETGIGGWGGKEKWIGGWGGERKRGLWVGVKGMGGGRISSSSGCHQISRERVLLQMELLVLHWLVGVAGLFLREHQVIYKVNLSR